MDFFNDNDINYLETFSKHNIIVFKSKKSKEQSEIINILKKQKFKRLFIVSDATDVLNILEHTNTSIIFFCIENINELQIIRNSINYEIKSLRFNTTYSNSRINFFEHRFFRLYIL